MLDGQTECVMEQVFCGHDKEQRYNKKKIMKPFMYFVPWLTDQRTG